MTETTSAAAFEALLGRGGAGWLVLIDDRLRIRRAGVGAAELADRPVDALPGMSLIAAFGSVTLDALARATLASGMPQAGEAELGQLSARTFAVDAVPVPGDGAVLSLHEITPLRRAERARRDFVANISHELRTPLASIKLLAETLAAGAVEDPESGHDFALQIGREVDHLAQLVDELLDLARIESGEVALAIEPLAPPEVLDQLAERIRPVAERRGITVRVLETGSGTDTGAMVAADSERLGQALLNLAHNAVKYSHSGGEVRLSWAGTERAIRFSVADDGIGIPEAHQARIFERFYKVDRSRVREGAGPERASAGLGLAIVRHIAEAHGGAVGMRSEAGAGSTFWIELPRAA